MKQNKHSIKQILIASLCTVSALTFGVGPGNLAQPLLGVPGQHDMLGGDYGNLAQPLLAGGHDGLPVQPPAQVGMGMQQPITIRVLLGIGGNEIAKFSLTPDTTMDELWEKVKALPSCPQYQASSISNGNAPWCTSGCVFRSVKIGGDEVHPISPCADSASINRLQQILDTHRAALPANALITILNDYNIVPASHMTIGQMLTRNNIDNSATIFVLRNETAIQAFEAQMEQDRRAVRQVNRQAAEKCDLCLERTYMTCIVIVVLSSSCYMCDQLVLAVGSL